MTLVALGGVQELSTNQTHQEEAVHRQSDHLDHGGEENTGGEGHVGIELGLGS